MNTTAVLMGGDQPVYALPRGRRFHEGAECAVLLGGQMVWQCRCLDLLCGHWMGPPPGPRAMSLGDAVLEGLAPCAVCYPGFRELAVQLPSDEDFGHRPVFLDGDWFCAKCRTRWTDEDGDQGEYPTLWPCTSAVVLKLAAPRGELELV